MVELTEKQKAVYDFIVAYICEWHRPPSRVDIRDGMGFKSGNSAQEYLAILEKKGAITLLDGDRNIHLNGVKLRVIHKGKDNSKNIPERIEKAFNFIKNYDR